jgi:hypothetical protein
MDSIKKNTQDTTIEKRKIKYSRYKKKEKKKAKVWMKGTNTHMYTHMHTHGVTHLLNTRDGTPSAQSECHHVSCSGVDDAETALLHCQCQAQVYRHVHVLLLSGHIAVGVDDDEPM